MQVDRLNTTGKATNQTDKQRRSDRELEKQIERARERETKKQRDNETERQKNIRIVKTE